MQQKTARTISLNRPDDPADEEDHGHGEGHVQVGIGTAEERLVDNEAVLGLVAPAHGADARDQADPVTEHDEDEDGGEEPEGLLHQFTANDAFKEIAKAFDHELPEVLSAIGDILHVAGGDLGKNDQAQGDDPAHDHGVGNGKARDVGDLDGFGGKRMSSMSGIARLMMGGIDRTGDRRICRDEADWSPAEENRN